MPFAGPTANLPGYARRSGRSGTVWRDGNMLGEVFHIDWSTAIAQIKVPIPGAWREEDKPGVETRTGTFMIQSLDDAWPLQVWRFVQARRNGDRSNAASIPTFSIVTKLDDVGAPDVSQWQLDDCMLFTYMGTMGQDVDLLTHNIPFSFRDDHPLHAWAYGPNGIEITEG